MSYYQNVFPTEFIGSWVLGDRQASLSFRCPANTGRGDEVVQSYGTVSMSSGNPTFNLSGNDVDGNAKSNLVIWYARDYSNGFKGWTPLTIAIAGAAPATTTLSEIVAALNADTTFSTMFTASVVGDLGSGIRIRQNIPALNLRFYIDNKAAETILRFNARAGIAELPQYFDRHTIWHRYTYADGCNQLIALSHAISDISVANPSVITSFAHGLSNGDKITIVNSNSNAVVDTASVVVANVTADTFTTGVNVAVGKGNYGVWAKLIDNTVIANASDKHGNTLGYTLTGAQRDYQLLQGRSGLFTCSYSVGDAAATAPNSRPIRTIIFPMGSGPGDLGKIIKYVYPIAGACTPTYTEEPYILTAADIAAAIPAATA